MTSVYFYRIQAAPGIQRIVELELVGQVLLILRVAQTVTGRQRFQPSRQRVAIDLRGDVGRVDYARQPHQAGSLRPYFRIIDSKEHRPS